MSRVILNEYCKMLNERERATMNMIVIKVKSLRDSICLKKYKPKLSLLTIL